MKYPKFLNTGDTIGITAPSAGVGHKLEGFDLSLQNLREEGYVLVETSNVRVNAGVSSSAEERANQLHQLVMDDQVAMILCATGGDFLMEMLPYVDDSLIAAHPKWIMGASDPTSLLFGITTRLDIATIYGLNAGGFDQLELHPSLENALEIVKGNLIQQTSFERWGLEKDETNWCYTLTDQGNWELLNGEFHSQGRLIGGCIDVLTLLLGTPDDHTKEFIDRYKQDGFIWYFDIYSLSSEAFYRSLFQMKRAGWFEYVKAVLVGRVRFPSTRTEVTYQKALRRIFPTTPIVFDADIGHTYPTMTIINGALGDLCCSKDSNVLRMYCE